MSAADIYRQYLTDYEDAAKKYNRSARAYQNTTDYYGGPIKAQSQDGQSLGLYSTPGTERQIVKQGTADDYQKAYQAANEEQRQAFGQYAEANDNQGRPTGSGTWTVREGQDGNAIHSFDGWQGGEGYYKDLGNGFAAARSGGRGTGQFVTERISGNAEQAQTMLASGKYKDVKYGDNGVNENGEPLGYIDVTYEQMRFPDAPGEFKAKKPSLSMAQTREMQNPTPSMAEVELNTDGGIIEAVRNKFAATSPAAGLIQKFR